MDTLSDERTPVGPLGLHLPFVAKRAAEEQARLEAEAKALNWSRMVQAEHRRHRKARRKMAGKSRRNNRSN